METIDLSDQRPDGVVDNKQRGRFELFLDGELAGWCDYLDDGEVVSLTHAEVPPNRRGTGAAAKLVDGLLDLLAEGDRTILARCGYVAEHIRKNPRHLDLVDARQRSSLTR